MMTSPAASQHHKHHHSATLDEFLAADDIVPVQPPSAELWDSVRRRNHRGLVWQFCTLRNLVVHRGNFIRDSLGFAWGGIYRTLLVGSIVSTSYRNEGLFRAGQRIIGTGDFFRGGFTLPGSSAEFHELVRMVNLRHHVAGVVVPRDGDSVGVVEGYEADYAYVATAFIESIRRGLAVCGMPADSARGRELGQGICTVLYHLAGFTGLTRMPRDLAAHERFRDAYDRRLAERPASPRVRTMGREIARRIVPVTAALSDETVHNHVRRHLDPETAEYLFPGHLHDGIDADLERQRKEWRRRLVTTPKNAIRARHEARAAIWAQPDVAALHRAYLDAAPNLTDDRLIGAILLHAIDHGREASHPLERRSIELPAGESLIRQGHTVGEMYVVLSATAPLVVLQAADPAAEPRQVATLAAPTVLGEIGMWRNRPAVASVLTREPNRLEVLVIDAARFESLKHEPGFRAATAAEVQRRLSLNSMLVGTLLDDTAARSGDPRLASITQLFRYLSGDSHVPLDAVIGLPEGATPAECVDALRQQVDEAIDAAALPPDLVQYLRNIMVTIG